VPNVLALGAKSALKCFWTTRLLRQCLFFHKFSSLLASLSPRSPDGGLSGLAASRLHFSCGTCVLGCQQSAGVKYFFFLRGGTRASRKTLAN